MHLYKFQFAKSIVKLREAIGHCDGNLHAVILLGHVAQVHASAQISLF